MCEDMTLLALPVEADLDISSSVWPILGNMARLESVRLWKRASCRMAAHSMPESIDVVPAGVLEPLLGGIPRSRVVCHV